MTKEQMNLLYTTRWHTRKLLELSEKTNVPGNQIKAHAEAQFELLSTLLGEKDFDQEPDRPNDPLPEVGPFEEPIVEYVPNVSFVNRGNYRTRTGNFSGLVVHYTVSGNTRSVAIAVLRYLSSKNLMCMVMDKDGIIYVPKGFDILKHWGYHAGVSKWNGASGVSNIFAGMEICCWGRNSKVGPFRSSNGEANIIPGTYQTYTAEQEQSLINFIKWAKANNPEFSYDNVCGHDELRTQAGKHGDKQDPGASLSMTMPKLRELIKL